jgi:hypothetical protein
MTLSKQNDTWQNGSRFNDAQLTTISKKTLNITNWDTEQSTVILCHNLSVIMASVGMSSIIMLSIIMLSIIMMSIIMLSIIMLSIVVFSTLLLSLMILNLLS